MKHIHIVTFCLLIPLFISAQQPIRDGNFYLEYALGNVKEASSPSSNNLAGFLLKDKSRSIGQFLRFQHFLNDKWGYFGMVQFHYSYSYDDLPKRIMPDADKYYTLNQISESNRDRNNNYLVGALYRVDSRYFSFRPYVGMGFTRFKTNAYSFDIKGKRNNEVLHSAYSMEKANITGFCASPGFNLVWKMGSGLHLFADIQYIHHFGSHKATHIVIDGYTWDTVKEESQKASMPNLWSLKFGVSIPFWKDQKYRMSR